MLASRTIPGFTQAELLVSLTVLQLVPNTQRASQHLQQLLQILVLPRPPLSPFPVALPALFETLAFSPPRPVQLRGSVVTVRPGVSVRPSPVNASLIDPA